VFGHARQGSPVLPAERDDVAAIVQRAEKERLFGRWRAEEYGTDPEQRSRGRACAIGCGRERSRR